MTGKDYNKIADELRQVIPEGINNVTRDETAYVVKEDGILIIKQYIYMFNISSLLTVTTRHGLLWFIFQRDEKIVIKVYAV